MKYLFNVLIIIFITINCFSSEQINFRKKDGLPSNVVHDLLVDSLGRLWILTDAGVSVYDGAKFSNLNEDNGLAELTNYKIFRDNLSRLWFVGRSGKLSYFDGTRIRKYRFNYVIDSIKGKISSPPMDFFSNSNTGIKIAFDNHGVIEIDLNGKAIHVQPKLEDKLMKGYYAERNNGSRLFYYSGYTAGFSLSHCNNSILRLATNGRIIMQKISRRINSTERFQCKILNDSLFFSFGSELYLLYEDSITLLCRFSSPIYSFLVDGQKIWIGFESGLDCINLKAKSNYNRVQSYLRGKIVSSIVKDFDGGLWVGTINEGVFHIPRIKIEKNIDLLFQSPDVSCLNNTSDQLMWGNLKGDIFLFEDSLRKFRSQYYPNSKIQDVIPFKGKIFCLSRNHVTKFDEMLNESLVFDSLNTYISIKKIIYEENDTILFVGKSLIELYSDFTFKTIYENDSGLFYINYASKVGKNEYWLASDLGVYQYLDKNIKPVFPIELGSVKSTIIKKVRNLLIVGTLYKGIYLIDRGNNKLYPLKFNNCRLSTYVTDIDLEDDENAWIATTDGLFHLVINYKDLSKSRLKRFGQKDGFGSENIRCIEVKAGSIILGTDKGVEKLNLKERHFLAESPVINLQRILINGQQYGIRNNYFLPPHKRNINLIFNSIDLKDDKFSAFAYRKIGNNSAFIFSPSNEISINSLSTGFHIFEFKSLNSKNVESDSLFVEFYISKPYWKRDWFRLVISYFFFFLLGLSIFIFRTIAKAKKAGRSSINQKIAELEMKALRSQMNPHFLFNALNSIYSMINTGEEGKASIYLVRFSKLLRLVMEQSMFIKVTLEEELRLLNIYLDLEQLRFENKLDSKIVLDPKLDPQEIIVPSFIFQPFAENAIIHGLVKKKSGEKRLYIEIVDGDELLICKIIDNGVGRKADDIEKLLQIEKKRSIAISNSKRRMEMVNIGKSRSVVNVDIRDLKDEDGNPCGTEVTLTMLKEFKEEEDENEHLEELRVKED